MRGADARERARKVASGLLFCDEPDPRVLQGVFALLLAVDLVLHDLPEGGVATVTVGGLALTTLSCAAAGSVPWSRTSPLAVGLLPVADLLALGLTQLGTGGAGSGILAVVPALWLGRVFGRPGAVVALLATALLVSLPALVHQGPEGVSVSRSLLVPLVAGWVAATVAGGLARAESGRAEAERRGQELVAALDLIDHQRRVDDAVLDTVDVGLVLLDRDGAYQSMNRRHADFMRIGFPQGHGGRAGQLGEVFAEDAVTPLTREEMPTYRASRGEEFDDVRLWIGADPLTHRALSVSARSVRDERGELAGAALAYKDVTDYMRALRVKDEFVASVSHELRTPLTSIMGYVDMLQEREDLPAGVPAQLEVVARNGDRLRRLVGDLLHTAQVDEGPMYVVRTRTDLSAVVRDAVAAAAPGARAAGISVELEVPDRLETMADAQRMAQVVDNLVSNAIKYTPPGGRVLVQLGVDADRVELVVSDTGIGIEAADRDRLFTRFFRARDAEERSIQGVGLGLCITRSIVESHGGRIEVESERGRGSVFRVRIPVDDRAGVRA